MKRANHELRWDQVRRLMRVLGEASEVPVDGGLRRQHMLDGLARILGSPAALVVRSDPRMHVCAVTCAERVNEPIVDVAITGYDAVTRPVFERMLESGCSTNPAILEMEPYVRRHAPGTHCVAAEHDLVGSRKWRESGYVVDLVRPAGLDHFLISAREFPDRSGNFAGFFRSYNDRPFDDRDYNLLDFFVAECSNLLWAPRGQTLPRRLRQVLEQLIAGDSSKQIAAHLGLSVHTVNEYIGTLYSRFGVRSRGELFAHLRTGADPLVLGGFATRRSRVVSSYA
jgi:DNA-binding CsgD family transcriptional regulator